MVKLSEALHFLGPLREYHFPPFAQPSCPVMWSSILYVAPLTDVHRADNPAYAVRLNSGRLPSETESLEYPVIVACRLTVRCCQG